MRKVKFEGWIIIDEEENTYGTAIIDELGDALSYIDGAHAWEIIELENEEIEYEEED